MFGAASRCAPRECDLTDQPSNAAPAKRYELTDPDVRLMLQVRDDNAAAFEQLVERYRDRLLKILEHMVHGRNMAEDLVQEVFLRVYRARKSYTPDAKFSTWLFTITDNVASNARRFLSRRKEVQISNDNANPSSPMLLDNLAKEPSRMMPARKLDQMELSEMVRAAIQSLNDRQRVALLLSKFEHMSYNDVAAAMNLTPKAVKSLLSRARNNLRDMLEPYVQGGNLPFGGGSDNSSDDEEPAEHNNTADGPLM